jgi:hypothetical protein
LNLLKKVIHLQNNMSEKMPVFETPETPEQRLIKLLQERGLDDPSAKEALIQWTIAQEQEVEQSKNKDAPIQLNLKRARLYFEAGLVDEAFENYEDAYNQAYNEYNDALCQLISDEMDEMERRLQE